MSELKNNPEVLREIITKEIPFDQLDSLTNQITDLASNQMRLENVQLMTLDNFETLQVNNPGIFSQLLQNAIQGATGTLENTGVNMFLQAIQGNGQNLLTNGGRGKKSKRENKSKKGKKTKHRKNKTHKKSKKVNIRKKSKKSKKSRKSKK